MKIGVIGAGLTGMLVALELAKHGCEVSLYEASDEVGGILRDVKSSEGIYFRNCQYINKKGTVFEVLENSDLTDELFFFRQNHGSINNLFESVSIVDGFAQLSIPKIISLDIKPNNNLNKSLKQRIEQYPKEISEPIIDWASGLYGNLDELDERNCYHLQLNRVYPTMQSEKVKELKQECSQFDSLLGLPRNKFVPEIEPPEVCLPIYGYDFFIDRILAKLKAYGVEMHLKKPVKVNNGKLYSRGEYISNDGFVWCGNPELLARNLLDRSLEVNGTNYLNITGDIECNETVGNYYIHTFLKNNNFTRVFFYTINSKAKFTIEAVSLNEEKESLIAEVNYFFNKYYPQYVIKNINVTKEVRYVLTGRNTLDRIYKLNERLSGTNIISTGWEHYGRDLRLKETLKKLQAKGFLPKDYALTSGVL